MSFVLSINGLNRNYQGWKSASLTRSIEQPAANFSFTAPHPQKDVKIRVQDEIEILINDIKQTQGTIFKITGTGDGDSASRTYSGRSLIADTIDSSAPLEPGLWQNVSAKVIINQLLKPFKITAEFLIEPKGETELRINPGDTVWQSIDKLLKKENLLAFEFKPGILTIDRAPETGSIATLEFGSQDIVSLQDYNLDMTNRFSSYTVIGEGLLGLPAAALGIATDSNIKNRPLIIQLSGNVDDARCQEAANYEMNVRAARSLNFSYMVPSWFTKNGDLWTPNNRVNIIDEENEIEGEHLLTSVTLNESEANEWAVLKFAPPESYTLKPPSAPASNELFSQPDSEQSRVGFFGPNDFFS